MALGIFFAMMVGLIWGLTGTCYQRIAHYKLSVFDIMIASSIVGLPLLALFFVDFNGLRLGQIDWPDAKYLMYIITGGFVNAFGSMTLQRAMRCEKTAMAWALGQSAMIIPFVSISLIFDEPADRFKILGTTAIIGGMMLIGTKASKTKEKDSRKALILALGAFFIIGAGQTILASSGYLKYQDEASLRTLLTAAGTLAAAIFYKAILRQLRRFCISREALALIAALCFCSLAGLILQFKAIDRLSDYSLNALFYPIAIGTCITVYSLYSAFILHERPGRGGIVGVLVILSGIALFCFAGK